jgi:hypothetical protein
MSTERRNSALTIIVSHINAKADVVGLLVRWLKRMFTVVDEESALLAAACAKLGMSPDDSSQVDRVAKETYEAVQRSILEGSPRSAADLRLKELTIRLKIAALKEAQRQWASTDPASLAAIVLNGDRAVRLVSSSLHDLEKEHAKVCLAMSKQPNLTPLAEDGDQETIETVLRMELANEINAADVLRATLQRRHAQMGLGGTDTTKSKAKSAKDRARDWGALKKALERVANLRQMLHRTTPPAALPELPSAEQILQTAPTADWICTAGLTPYMTSAGPMGQESPVVNDTRVALMHALHGRSRATEEIAFVQQEMAVYVEVKLSAAERKLEYARQFMSLTVAGVPAVVPMAAALPAYVLSASVAEVPEDPVSDAPHVVLQTLQQVRGAVSLWTKSARKDLLAAQHAHAAFFRCLDALGVVSQDLYPAEHLREKISTIETALMGTVVDVSRAMGLPEGPLVPVTGWGQASRGGLVDDGDDEAAFDDNDEDAEETMPDGEDMMCNEEGAEADSDDE